MFDDHSDDPAVMADINTTPLIDVMLVLLIMLIITVPLQTHSIIIDNPAGPVPVAQTMPDVVRVDIDDSGAISWNGEPVGGRDRLIQLLHQAAIADNAPEVHVRPQGQTAYGHFAAVMAAAQSQGVTKLGVIGAEQFLPHP